MVHASQSTARAHQAETQDPPKILRDGTPAFRLNADA
jgi:hypothetical protein